MNSLTRMAFVLLTLPALQAHAFTENDTKTLAATDSHGYSVTLTIHLDTVLHQMRFNAQASGDHGGTPSLSGGFSFVYAAGSAVTDSLATSDGNYYYPGSPYTYVEGYTATLVSHSTLSGGGGTVYSAIQSLTWGVSGNYKVSFSIPANNTDRYIRYEVYQDGSYTGLSYTSAPGEAASIQTFQPLHSDHLATLQEVTPNLVHGTDPDGRDIWFFGDPSYKRVVNGGSSPIATESSGGTPGAVTSPTAPAGGLPPVPIGGIPSAPPPHTPTPTAPTSSPSAPTPTPTSTPNPTPSGTDPTKKQDTEKQTNDLVTALNNNATANTAGFNAIITAVDRASTSNVSAIGSVVTAINTQTDQITKLQNNQLTVLGQISSGQSKTNELLTTTNSKLDTLTTAVNQGQDTTAGTAAASAMATQAMSDFTVHFSAAQTAVGNSANTFLATNLVSGATNFINVTPLPGDNGYALQSHNVAMDDNSVLQGATGGTLDTNPFTSDALSRLIGSGTALKFCNFIRQLIGWSTVVSFLIWTFGEVKSVMVATTTAPPLQLTGSSQLVSRVAVFGNSVGVPFAATVYAFQVAGLSTFILACPTVLVAAFTLTSDAPALVTSATTATQNNGPSALSEFLKNAMSYMYVILPVATLITCFVNRLLVRIGSIVQFILNVVVFRIIQA